MSANGYDVFCDVTGYNRESLRACFEFSMYTGFDGINVWKLGYPDGEAQISDAVSDRIKMFEGPNGPTMVKAYLAKRNSLSGRLSALWRKPIYVTAFMLLVVACLIRNAWRSA